MANPFIADNYFKENPTKVLGEQTIKKGRFNNDMVYVKGNISNIQKIDAEPIKVADLFPESVQTYIPESKAIEEVFKIEVDKDKSEKVSKLRGKKEKPLVETAKQAVNSQEVYSYAETNRMYNTNISREELEAYYFCHPELNYKLLFDEFTLTKEQFIEKNLICYDHETKTFIYYYSYVSGYINKKVSNLQRDKQFYIDVVGEQQYEKQLKMLISVKPAMKGFIGNDKIILLPHANLCKETKITELRYGKPELYGETSVLNAFKQWLRYIPSDSFDKSNYREVIEYYIDNKAPKVSGTNLTKDEKAREEKKNINAKQRSKEEGDRLFAKFLAEELTADDQAKLAYLWNEKFNSIVEPDLSKIPVCFRISKTFKSGKRPLCLNPTQRQAVAFMMEKKSGLFAYGVGVGKTLASIACASQAIDNGLAKHPCFVVPTNTYDKWIGEIQGFVDKQTGVFNDGALPHLPPVEGLYNLNPNIVYEKLKEYSKEDELILNSILEAQSFCKSLNTDEISDAKRSKVDKIYAGINWKGLEIVYQEYIEDSKAKTQKVFSHFVADYLKEEYNYKVYELGTVKTFPTGTIFVITEVGVQRLGVSDSNKEKLTDRLYSILSQGELSADKESKRDVAALQSKIEQTISSSLKNAKINIEDIGIDFVCFDEAHYYKKLFTYVKGQVVGEKEDWKTGEVKKEREKTKYELKSGQYPSGRALSAFVLSSFVQMQNNNRNVIQLTATPFTNSPLEVFSMLTLTNYAALEEAGLDNMIDFFDTFMRITYDIKYTPQKTVVKDISLTGYNNLSQLRQIIYSLMDKKDEGANLQRPNKIIYPSIEKGIETTIPMTSEQEELMSEVKKYLAGSNDYESICQQALMDEVESMDFDGLEDEVLITEWERSTGKEFEGDRDELTESKREQMIKSIKSSKVEGIEMGEEDLSKDESAGVRILKGLSMMRQITLSPYLYYKACKKASGSVSDMPNYKDYVNSSPKFKYVMGCIASVINFHKSRNEKISGQVIYMNAGVEYFSLLKQYLVKEIGLSETQVGIVSGGMSKSAKESVKNKFLSGDILVLIGSSSISVGVDLQNNSTVLYNCYYDWNPTDAQQIEGRIWRQGNRFSNVRIVYPMCYNSADPVLFEYLNSKTLRINEIWNRSSTIQELDLRDFNPKELQKKLITDPEEKADFEILIESEAVESQIIYYENRVSTLGSAIKAYQNVNRLKPLIAEYLTKLQVKKLDIARSEAIKNQKEKINEIVEKFSDNVDKMSSEIAKYKASRYDHENDPEGKYAAEDYMAGDMFKIYTDAAKYLKIIEDWGWKDDDIWGRDLTDNKYKMQREMQEFRGSYKEMVAAEDKILKPLGLSFETAANPFDEINAKLAQLREQLNTIENGKDERVKRLKEEMLANMANIKTVEDRIKEFASDNPKLLTELAFLGENKPELIEAPKPEETADIVADNKLEAIKPSLETKTEVVAVIEEPVSNEFTFMKDNPMQRARALNVLEKSIKSDGKIMPVYKWVEDLPKDLQIGQSKIGSSKSDKGYVVKNTIGDYIIESKAEIDYYKYLVQGGYPYSSYLQDEKIRENKQKEIKKAQDEIDRIEYEKKQVEIAVSANEAKKRQIKDLIENGVEPTIQRRTKGYKAEIEDLQNKRQTENVKQEIGRLERYIEQEIRQSETSYQIATKLYKIVDGEVVKKYDWKVGDKVLYDGKIETEIEEIKQKPYSAMVDDFTYKVKKVEGIYNPYIGYDGIYPIEKTEQPTIESIKKELVEPQKALSKRELAVNKINAINLGIKFLKGDALAKAQQKIKSLEFSIKYLKD